MNKQQKILVETHMDVVKWAIIKHMRINETVVGLGYDDLYQEGCAALCKAASTYDGSVKFVTYAQVVVKNALISYCRRIRRNKTGADLPLDEADTFAVSGESFDENTIEHLMEAELLKLLESFKAEYSGTTQLGIEVLALKVKGYSGADIALMYGVKPNLVGAWISRAAAKLKQDERFLNAIM